jgi:hypothetical protein
MMTSLVRVDGVSVKTTFRDPRHLEFDLPAGAVARATPNPYRSPGPAQSVGIIGDRAVAVHVFNPLRREGPRIRFINWCCRGKRALGVKTRSSDLRGHGNWQYGRKYKPDRGLRQHAGL